jgi:uncharacterized protein YjiS (DUF1127 family)
MRYASHSQYLLGDTTPAASFGRIARTSSTSSRLAGVVTVSANEADIRTVAPRDPAEDLNGIALHAAARKQQSRAVAALIVAVSQALSASIRRVLLEMRKRREEQVTYRALAELDARTLKDIGIDRGEIRSVAHGLAYGDTTRVLLFGHRGA